MGRKLERKIDVSVVLILCFITPMFAMDPQEHPVLLYSFAVLLIVTFIIRNFVVYIDLRTRAGGLVLWGQLLLAAVMTLVDQSFISQIFLLFLIGEAAFHRKKLYSCVYTLTAYLTFVVGRFAVFSVPAAQIWEIVIPKSLEFICFFAISYLAKYIAVQKHRLSNAHERMKQASIQLEETTMLKERTRISREIHDTIGHSLTTAIMGIEAGRRLLKQDEKKAEKLLGDMKQQLQTGLNEVRKSVRTLSAPYEPDNFTKHLTDLIEDTRDRTGVRIAYEIEKLDDKLNADQAITIVRALQEGLANGLRHGKSTDFQFTLEQHTGRITFHLVDNGRGFTVNRTAPGFGLMGMEERVRQLNGEFQINSIPGKGTAIAFSFPLTEGKDRIQAGAG
ncbi:sensor histidine kinase [Sediminibacillus halophilus]|uniref:histidine kinase n=1 Tax=Sediminibacillus halophilus TaxID=482461 RepID=A0A1G9VGB7_9BACI|nr:sensor histidine kinase [Sediminibacillus halophilus]SDM71166.1 Signal transduction histidine kinase [Sediminibacillus halophilus]